MTTPFWGQKSFVVITGASRGIGRGLAIDFCPRLASGSVCLLLARNLTDLQATRSLVQEVAPSIHVITKSFDLCQPDKDVYRKIIEEAIGESSGENFDLALVVHNAAAGDPSHQLKASQLDDVSKLQDYFKANITATIVLTSQFLKLFPGDRKGQKRAVVQLSCNSAVNPIKSISLYGTVKAATSLYLKSVAFEEPEVITLSYAPGMLDTDSFHAVRLGSYDEELKKSLDGYYQRGELVTTAQTAQKLALILEKGIHTKGEHTEYHKTQFSQD